MAGDVAALAAEMTPYLSAAVGPMALAIAKSVREDAEQAANWTHDDRDLHCPAGSPGKIDATGPARLRGRTDPVGK
jgi:hypothetical protein